jgi:hypothetical protein
MEMEEATVTEERDRVAPPINMSRDEARGSSPQAETTCNGREAATSPTSPVRSASAKLTFEAP